MNPIVFAMRRPFTVMVLVVAVALSSVLAISRMSDRHLPEPEPPCRLRLPAVRRDGPGADGRLADQLLRVSLSLHLGNPSRREPQRAGDGGDEAVLSSRHEHGAGDGGDDRLCDAVASVHAAGNRLAVHHPVRRWQRSRRLPRAIERDQVDRRDPGPGTLQGEADVREPAGGLGAAAIRRQSANGGGAGRPRAAPVVFDLARRADDGPDERQHDQSVGERADRQDDADRADQLAGARCRGAGKHSDPRRRKSVGLHPRRGDRERRQ